MFTKTALITLSTIFSFTAISAENSLHFDIPTAKDISQAVRPPSPDCEQCMSDSVSIKMNDEMRKLKAKYACREGKKRLDSDKNFYISSIGSLEKTTNISGNFQEGLILTGEISNFYSGVSAFNDLMMLSEVKEGNKIIGYNVTVSMCEVPNAYAGYPALVSDNRPLRSFTAPYGITIGYNSACGMGVVEVAMNTTMISQRSTRTQQSALTLPAPIYTSFVRTDCR